MRLEGGGWIFLHSASAFSPTLSVARKKIYLSLADCCQIFLHQTTSYNDFAFNKVEDLILFLKIREEFYVFHKTESSNIMLLSVSILSYSTS